jgi:hypothetical protein
MTRWAYTIRLADVFHNETMTFEQRRDAIVGRLRTSKWYQAAGVDSDLHVLLEELGEVEDKAGFDELWSDVYDLADYDRTWIVTR